MWKQLRRLGWIVVLVLGIGGAFAATATAQATSATAPKTIDDLYADVARLAPGFGGLYVDPDQDILYVYLLEDTPAAVATLESALTAVFGSRAPKQSRLVVLQGRYSFLDLKAWYDRMSGVVGGIPGVTLTDIDDAKNRLYVGVETPEVQAQVEEELARLGVPREAVIIEEHPPFIFSSSLLDLHRPLVGGLQIKRLTNPFPCSLGFNAIRAGDQGFVTASHCTDNPGGEEGTLLHQPFPPDQIGVETVDPRYKVTHADDPSCPLNPDGTTRFCRYSDSAFVRRDAGVEADRGFIAQPPLDSTEWNGVDRFRIVADVTNDMINLGDHVNKVGRTTGWTRGTVTRVCFAAPVGNTNVTLICQSEANFGSAIGDSGAPVFNIIDTLFPNVRLYGILWGVAGGTSAFSPIENIQRADFELGPLTKCAPLFGC